MTGRRLPDESDWSSENRPGDYWKRKGGWYALTPNELLANLRKHDVTEEPDGTITVSPSIFVNQGQPVSWHGFLERGVWRSC